MVVKIVKYDCQRTSLEVNSIRVCLFSSYSIQLRAKYSSDLHCSFGDRVWIDIDSLSIICPVCIICRLEWPTEIERRQSNNVQHWLNTPHHWLFKIIYSSNDKNYSVRIRVHSNWVWAANTRHFRRHPQNQTLPNHVSLPIFSPDIENWYPFRYSCRSIGCCWRKNEQIYLAQASIAAIVADIFRMYRVVKSPTNYCLVPSVLYRISDCIHCCGFG